MPNITMITGEIDPVIQSEIAACGTVTHLSKATFTESIDFVRKQRETDLLITALPELSPLGPMGYYKSAKLILETVNDMRIPVIVYTGCGQDTIRILDKMPVFLVHRRNPIFADSYLVGLVMGIAEFWFPLSATARSEFMARTLAEFGPAVTDAISRDIFMMEKFDFSTGLKD